jgi:hypothetical protein
MMEAARSSEMLVNFYQTTWRYKPEDSHLLDSFGLGLYPAPGFSFFRSETSDVVKEEYEDKKFNHYKV